ncbi:nucleolar transcription factor 1-like isoform X2 [Coregonus clupeaformis]|uniref:nucleolar transcription factor 1-like isoform X2 n=1 Tax=Coregonus clupeaformis TaxID=59861 RepID=UPI001BE0AAA3|nr:nucleolar transcription factor 1-like isoform X2 [Coregonus clupeaformis]
MKKWRQVMKSKVAWGREDLIKLLHGIKENIPKGDTSIYTKGERTLEWDKVAFHPYSPQMCHQKWKELSIKLRKMRSLAELVTEAEGAFENPFQGQNWKIHPDFPRRPNPPNSIFSKENFKRFEKQQPEMMASELFTFINEKYSELPEHKKAIYIAKFQKEKELYEKSMRRLRKEYTGVKKVRRDCLKNIKGPLTPHGLWYRHERRKFLLANPDARGDCIRQSIEQKKRWSELPDKEKLKWIKRSLEQQTQYEEEEMEEHPESKGSRKAKHKPLLRKSERLLKDLADGKPDKPPWNGYNLFCKEQKAIIQGEGVPNTQYMVICSQRWKTMTKSKKEAYQRRCDKLKKEYEVNMNRFLCTVTDKEQQRILVENRKSVQTSTLAAQKGTKIKFQGEPKKPPEWGHTMFYSEKMAELRAESSHLSSRECMAVVSPLWKKLSQKEKECYQRMAQERTREYQVELHSWFNTMFPKEQAKYLEQNPNKLKILDNPEQGRMAKQGRTSDSEDEDLEDDIDTSSDEEEVEDDSDDEEEDDDEDMTDKENCSGSSSSSSSSEEDSDTE